MRRSADIRRRTVRMIDREKIGYVFAETDVEAAADRPVAVLCELRTDKEKWKDMGRKARGRGSRRNR